MKPVVLILSDSAADLGARIATLVDGEVHGAKARVASADVLFDTVKNHVQGLFASGRNIIGVMASGALIRLLAPMLSDKMSEPAVLAVSEDGASVVPLLGGHHGAMILPAQLRMV